MSSCVLFPYNGLHSENAIGNGALSFVYGVTSRIAFKSVIRVSNPGELRIQDMEDSTAAIAAESVFYDLLEHNPHPHIMHRVLKVEHGVFLHRMSGDLFDRINAGSITEQQGIVWIQQLASGLAWIEQLGWVHGDLHPCNVFLDAADNIQLGDFDATVKIGEETRGGAEPWCRLLENCESPVASPATEQFALGACIYFIRFGRPPLAHIEDRMTLHMMLFRRELDCTDEDALFGQLITDCWNAKFPSIASVSEQIKKLLVAADLPLYEVKPQACGDPAYRAALLEETKTWIAENGPSRDWVDDISQLVRESTRIPIKDEAQISAIELDKTLEGSSTDLAPQVYDSQPDHVMDAKTPVTAASVLNYTVPAWMFCSVLICAGALMAYVSSRSRLPARA
ncbi:hypothetical protein ANO11243_018760 [Dothideomycetidae sp. 11243]|nr:hypothetical protein ANO11243_018760 [fungal sp. No.11243]